MSAKALDALGLSLLAALIFLDGVLWGLVFHQMGLLG